LLAFLCAVPSIAQQVAFTFDDLPSHGDLAPGQTRLEIAQSILRTLHDQHMPAVYGFVNAEKLERNPDEIAALKAWCTAGNPPGSHTYLHPFNSVPVLPKPGEQNQHKHYCHGEGSERDSIGVNQRS
jgi:peptidoglycan/xylan/chitin deacetylase (PgdA/CDA1 family)